jgi:hypothetical protein
MDALPSSRPAAGVPVVIDHPVIDATCLEDTPGVPDPLRAYLAIKDEPCPECGYNLRGVEDGRCPECGHGLRLAVEGATARNGFIWFLLLALGWVFIASGMNAARYGRQAYREARSSFVVLPGMSVRGTLTPSGAMVWSQGPTVTRAIPAPSVAITVPSTSGPGAGGATQKALVERQAALNARAQARNQAVQLQAQSLQIQAQTLRSFSTVGGPAAVAGSGNLTLNLSAVQTMTWVSLGWWGSLGLAAMASLIVVAVVWPRRKTSAPRPLLVLACTLFVLYAGYHTLMFAREIAA